jgi:hypothetical protein
MADKKEFILGRDYYLEDGRIHFTKEYLEKRGPCCGNECRHCPYEPKHTKGKVVVSEKLLKFTHNNFNNGAE